MTEHAVVVAGAGPAGLMLAGELALAGVDVAIVERRPDQELNESRARGLHARTIEVLDQRGIADRFLARGRPAQVQAFAGTVLDISDFPTRHNYGLALAQRDFEQLLAAWVAELGVRISYAHEVTGYAQDGGGVDVTLSDGDSLRGEYLVGCDGGRSIVRRLAGIDFPGWDASVNSLIAEVSLRDEPPWGIRYDRRGTQAIGKLDDGRRAGIVVTETYNPDAGPPTLEELQRALVDVWGTDFGLHNPTRLSRFSDMTRQAATYRQDRVLLAGDAAHVHYPIGGQGLNLGVQDAANLGWKLAQVVKQTSPQTLLDTYDAERRPVGAQMLQTTMAQTGLARDDARIQAVRETLSMLLRMDEPRRRIAGMLSGLDIRYDLGDGHPLVGRRVPDLELRTDTGSKRVFELLHTARPQLLIFGGPSATHVSAHGGRIDTSHAIYDGVWELPVVGVVSAPQAVLIRPDGYVAWAGDHTDDDLAVAVNTWFGEASVPET